MGCASLVGGLGENLEEWFPVRDDFAPPGDTGNVWRYFLVIKLENVALLVSSGWRPQMLTIIRGTGQPMTKDYLALSAGSGAKTKRLRETVLTCI